MPYPELDPAVAAERERCRRIAESQIVGDDADERIRGIIDAINDGAEAEEWRAARSIPGFSNRWRSRSRCCHATW